MSRVIRFKQTGDADVLQIQNETVPAPEAGEVQIEVAAFGLNRAEVMFRRGQYLESPELPARIGYEASGTITAIGDGVTGFNIGDAVSTIPNFSMNHYGSYAETANMPVTAVTHHPPGLGWDQAAAIWMQYLTAYGALIDIANMQAEDYVLIPAASSSVGLAAIQLCNLIGAVPIALTRSSHKKTGIAGARCSACCGQRRTGCHRRSGKYHSRRRRQDCVRPGRRSDAGNPGPGHGETRHHFPIWRTEPRSQSFPAVQRPGQRTDDTWLYPV